MGCTCITYHFVTYKLLNIDEWLWSFGLNSRTLASIIILYSFHVRLHLFDCHMCIIIIICNVENIYLSGISSQSEIGKDVGRGGDSGGRTFSGTTTGGGETKPDSARHTAGGIQTHAGTIHRPTLHYTRYLSQTIFFKETTYFTSYYMRHVVINLSLTLIKMEMLIPLQVEVDHWKAT